VEAVVEAGKVPVKGFVPAVSENYLKLLVKSADGFVPGTLIRCKILDCEAACNFDAIAEGLAPFNTFSKGFQSIP
jgi:hypothetical protein